ncbi:MAG: creatininase family protein [Phototrophicaceae bacterium]
MRTRKIAHLRPDEILPELQATPVAYLPFGLLEWHGPHLPLGVDSFNAEAIAVRAANQTGGLVMPTIYCGTERERPPEVLDDLGFERDTWIVGMDFPHNSLPSMYASEEIFALTVRENLRLTAAMGFKVLVVISGHAATNQIETLRRIAAEFNAAGQVKVLVELPFVANASGTLEVGHASRIETAVMLALEPESVRLKNLPPQSEPLNNTDFAIVDYDTFLGRPTPDRTVSAGDDPRRADADAGERMMAQAAEQITRRVRRALETIE